MVLIIGGRNQGKLEYSIKQFGFDKEDISFGLSSKAKVVYGFHNIIRKMLSESEENQENIKLEGTLLSIEPISSVEGKELKYIHQAVFQFVDENPDVIIICDEVGCGLVPLEKGERIYREAVGRICCELAARAQQVHRIICGIGVVIKDA